MADFAVTVALLESFAPIMQKVVQEMVKELTRKNVVRQEDNSTFTLERPENRLGLGKKIVEGRETLAICLEKNEGPAYNEATTLQQKSPEKVSIVVVGYAQSVWPKSGEQQAGPKDDSLQIGSS